MTDNVLAVPAYSSQIGVVAPVEGGTVTIEIRDGSVERYSATQPDFVISPAGALRYLIPTLTVNEIRHLFAKLITNTVRTITYWLHRSTWRRRHQQRALTSHYKRRHAGTDRHPST